MVNLSLYRSGVAVNLSPCRGWRNVAVISGSVDARVGSNGRIQQWRWVVKWLVIMAVAQRLADAGVDVIEAPSRPNQIRGYQALKRLHALPRLMDEGVVLPVELEEAKVVALMKASGGERLLRS
jgi:hypothetical protein